MTFIRNENQAFRIMQSLLYFEDVDLGLSTVCSIEMGIIACTPRFFRLAAYH